MRAILVASVLLTSSAARADDETVKSEDTATWLSAGGALGSVALVGIGFGVYEAFPPSGPDNPPETLPRLFKVPLHNWGNGFMAAGIMSSMLSPDLGHWYAHEYLTGGLGLRAAGLLVIGLASIPTCDRNLDSCNASTNVGLAVVGVLLYGAGIAHSIATAPRAARAYNRKHQVSAVPTLVSAGSSTMLGVAGRF